MLYSIINVSPQPIFIRLPSIPVLSNANYKKVVLSNTNNTARLSINRRYSQFVKNNHVYRNICSINNLL